MNSQTTRRRTLRAAHYLTGARIGRRHVTRTAVIRRQLDQIAPGVHTVRTVPVWTDGTGTVRLTACVVLLDALGLSVRADRAAHRAAYGLLRRLLPGTDWTHPYAYDVATGVLVLDAPALPEELY
ncbi:hypothetical protein SEA_HFRANCETTE_35 [Streptomyces phage HFrancette]|uniref:Uncharacterized protein n=1 Tax=Streptomyces phage HFrancette TaxID=2926108 RepID=A0A9E7NIS2_9CAUD|nr:hypothetical protein QEN64_gp35 [Streptomyces phage HFrancette]UTN92129.1 hypothetical protein SEA_HFRANCETTE_35 [Streptomyces phage HFrancette]